MRVDYGSKKGRAMSGLRFESMADMPPRMRELYAKQARDLSGDAAPAPLAKGSQGKPKYGSKKAERGAVRCIRAGPECFWL